MPAAPELAGDPSGVDSIGRAHAYTRLCGAELTQEQRHIGAFRARHEFDHAVRVLLVCGGRLEASAGRGSLETIRPSPAWPMFASILPQSTIVG